MQGAPLDPFPEGSAAALLLLRERTIPGGTAQHHPHDEIETNKNHLNKNCEEIKEIQIPMLKKIISMLLALCLAAVAFVPAFAETAQAPEKKVINWDAVRQQQFAAAGFAGTFRTYTPSNLSLMIPDGFRAATVEEASAANGCIEAFVREDLSSIGVFQKKLTDAVEFHSMDEVETLLRKGTPDGNFQRVVVNGLEVLIQVMLDKDMSVIMTLLDNGEIFMVTCTNLMANKELYSFVAASLQLSKSSD